MKYTSGVQDKEYILPGCQTLLKTAVFGFIIFLHAKKIFTLGDKYDV